MSLDHPRRGIGRRGLAPAALGLALLLLPAVLPASPTPDEQAKMSRRTAALWSAGGDRFRAVLHLAGGSDAAIPLAPRGLKQSKRRLDAVVEVEDRVLSSLNELLQPGDLEVRHRYRLRPSVAVDLSRRGLEAALSMPEVVWVEEAELWLAHTAEGVPLVGADALHAAGVTGEGLAIAIVDTGVDFLHPALGAGAIPNGVVVYGLDTADGDSNPRDCGTHGTAVASIAAGRPHVWASPTRFAGGVSPGASILAYKASPDDACGTFDSRDVVAALEDAVLHRDQYNLVAVNLSLGGEPSAGPCDGDGAMSSYAAAIEDATMAGVAVVVSSGNEASASALDAPACVSGAISVASVYDGPVGPIAYCGSGAGGACIPYLCQEPGGVADAVPCYANTNHYLDLFAPSEILTVAERSGTVMEFGGTSGAAPYVTGAIALLHQALPDMDPMRARFLLGLTGHPVTDPDRGVTRPRLDLVAAIAARGIAVGQASVPIPAEVGVPALSTASVDAPGFVESVEVTVKVLHGRPRQLLVTLEAPDGTRVRLHDRGAGMTSEASGDYLDGATGVWATYPADTAPAQSLELLSDLPAAGTWTLAVVDLDPATAPGAPPRIVGWGLKVTTSPLRRPPQLTAGSLVIPVAARSSGTGGTFWVTDTRLLNRSTSSEAAVRLYLVPHGADGTTSFHLATVTVPPRTVLDLPDVVGGLLRADQVQGNLLLVTGSPDLHATSRTYNTGGGAGTFGQYVPVAATGAAAAAGETPVMLLQLASGLASRTNIGLSEISGSEVTVTTTLLDGTTGALLGTTNLTVSPWSNIQVNDVFAAVNAPPCDNAYATVEATAGAGRAVAYASVVDRSTGDAIFVPGSRPVSGSSWLVPIVARAPGSQGTSWVSDLRVFNGSDVAVDLRLELRPEATRGGNLLQTLVTVGPGRVLALDDAAGLLVPSGSTTGSLRLAPTRVDAPLLVTSRTYNRTDGGTFGQYVPAVGPGSGSTTAVSLIHLDGGADFRTNLGLCEVGGGSVSLRYVLRDATGSTLGVGTTDLGPYEVKQVNDLHGSLGVSDGHNTRVDVYLDGGDGAFAAYASVVDNLSGDAVFIPSY